MPPTPPPPPSPTLLVRPTVAEAARTAAHLVAEHLCAAVADRGIAGLAVSGGSSPALMLDALAALDVPWDAVHVFQVDERIAAPGHPDRNATQLRAHLLDAVPLPSTNVHLLSVDGLAPDDSGAPPADPDAAARRDADELHHWFPDGLDLVHLGLGDDGHTASLVPGDPVLDVEDRAVAVTGDYRGRSRLTLTYPELRRARRRLWFVTGAAKQDMLGRLLAHDRHIPAGRLVGPDDLVVADAAAAPAPAPAPAPAAEPAATVNGEAQ